MKKYIPRKGDVIYVSFNPQSGKEQRGHRPALVVSNTLFNQRTGLAMVCPVTNTDRGWGLHVRLPAGFKLSGVVMVEQIKSIDYTARKARYIEKAPQDILNEVLAILDACIYDETQ